MSDKIKEILETPVIPDELKPENIPELLEKRGGKGSSDDVCMPFEEPQLHGLETAPCRT